jgi:hypothetical protein
MEENGISHMDDHVVTLEEFLGIMQQKATVGRHHNKLEKSRKKERQDK